eukprot:COSAG01_NODE_3936_length_5515_cov_5.199889_3_plen_403_part_00
MAGTPVSDDPDGELRLQPLPGQVATEFVGLLPAAPSSRSSTVAAPVVPSSSRPSPPPPAPAAVRARPSPRRGAPSGRDANENEEGERVRQLFTKYLITHPSGSSLQSPQQLQREQSRERRLQQSEDLELTYREFCMLMKGEWHAEDADVQTMWKIPGFTDQRNDVSRQHVLKMSTYNSKMEALGLKQRPSDRTLPDDDDDGGGRRPGDDDHLVDEVLDACCGRCGKMEPQKHFCLRQTSDGWRSVLSIWDAWLLLLLGVVVTTIPVRIGFEIVASTDGSGLIWMIVDIVMDLSFIADIVKNFLVLETLDGSLAATKEEREGARKRYFKSWFWPDLIASLPFAYIQLALESAHSWVSSSKLFRLLRLIRLVKMLRISKLQYRLRGISVATGIQLSWLRLAYNL